LIHFLYKNEYKIFKHVKNHHKKKTEIERGKMERINQFGIQYIYT
jgi:hypothetical protein